MRALLVRRCGRAVHCSLIPGVFMDNLAVIILAAGLSTRMKSEKSKVLHKICGLPLIYYSINEVQALNFDKLVIVVGRDKQLEFEPILPAVNNLEYCEQKEAKGTADAVMSAASILKEHEGYTLILPGDVPLITGSAINHLIDTVSSSNSICGVISTYFNNPYSYGRIVRDEKGDFVAIREEKDASVEEKKITEINTGVFLIKSKWLFEKLEDVKPENAQKEYYLTDIVEMAIKENLAIKAVPIIPATQFVGVNTREDLAYVDKMLNMIIAKSWMDAGVSIQDPNATYIDSGVEIGVDSFIAPSCFLRGRTKIGKNCRIDTGAVIEDSIIGDNVHVKPYTVIENGELKNDVIIGPFSRIRPETILEKDVRVGNFVEVKKSILHVGVKANHLTYIGDAEIGAKTNIGCGTITCNYDGKKKHKTTIGKNVFVGSDTQFVAPVSIGDGAVIGAGSTITKDVPENALALSRAKQENIKDYKKK